MFVLLRAMHGGPYPLRTMLFCFWKLGEDFAGPVKLGLAHKVLQNLCVSAEPFFNRFFTMWNVLQNLPAEPQKFCRILGNLWESGCLFWGLAFLPPKSEFQFVCLSFQYRRPDMLLIKVPQVSDVFVIFSALFCHTPFAGLLLRQGDLSLAAVALIKSLQWQVLMRFQNQLTGHPIGIQGSLLLPHMNRNREVLAWVRQATKPLHSQSLANVVENLHSQGISAASTTFSQFHSQNHSHSLADSFATLNSQLFVSDMVAKIRYRLFGARQNSHSHSQLHRCDRGALRSLPQGVAQETMMFVVGCGSHPTTNKPQLPRAKRSECSKGFARLPRGWARASALNASPIARN